MPNLRTIINTSSCFFMPTTEKSLLSLVYAKSKNKRANHAFLILEQYKESFNNLNQDLSAETKEMDRKSTREITIAYLATNENNREEGKVVRITYNDWKEKPSQVREVLGLIQAIGYDCYTESWEISDNSVHFFFEWLEEQQSLADNAKIGFCHEENHDNPLLYNCFSWALSFFKADRRLQEFFEESDCSRNKENFNFVWPKEVTFPEGPYLPSHKMIGDTFDNSISCIFESMRTCIPADGDLKFEAFMSFQEIIDRESPSHELMPSSWRPTFLSFMKNLRPEFTNHRDKTLKLERDLQKLQEILMQYYLPTPAGDPNFSADSATRNRLKSFF